MTAADWIHHLELIPHPEGGYFRESYRATESISPDALPERYNQPRHLSTAIFFLLISGHFSAFHRVQSDELWHFHDGSPLTLHLLDPDGRLRRLHLGLQPHLGQLPQQTIPAGTWFAASVDDPDTFTLVGCTVAPGFDFADFQLADRRSLCADFPQHADLIIKLTRRSS